MSLQHFLANEWYRTHAQKRGGTQGTLPINFQAAENRYGIEPADTLTPERLFARRWALTLLEQVLGWLREEFAREGKSVLFDQLKKLLAGQASSRPYDEIAKGLGMTEGAIKTAVHRLRRRYRELLKAQIAETVAGPEDLEDERRELFAAVSKENQ